MKKATDKKKKVAMKLKAILSIFIIAFSVVSCVLPAPVGGGGMGGGR